MDNAYDLAVERRYERAQHMFSVAIIGFILSFVSLFTITLVPKAFLWIGFCPLGACLGVISYAGLLYLRSMKLWRDDLVRLEQDKK